MTERGGLDGRGWLVLMVRLLVGAIFVYAAMGKVGDPAGFARAVHNYRILPLPLLHPFALMLPWVELLTGLALILGRLSRGAVVLCLGMTMMFTIAVGSALARNLDISCGCFHTDGGASVGLSLLLRDVALLAACVLLLFWRRSGGLGWGFLRRRS
jgi:putative oxidoreductase